MAKPCFRLFLTPAGLAVLTAALVILIRSLLARNSYEILISSAALFFLLVTGITGAWKAYKLKSIETSWKLPFPVNACSGEKISISCPDENLPLFYRIHFYIRGFFYPSGFSAGKTGRRLFFKRAFHKNGGCPVLAETSVSGNKKTAHLPLDFPMSGVFYGDGFCRLKDIFGFFSFSCGIPQSMTVMVRTSPYFGKDFPVNPQSGAEDKRNKTSSDEERYYMREYTPGDRFRDINWKSSEKIDSLITRISPDNQEKVSRIEIFFRNYGPADKPSLDALWLLDRAKAQLSNFMRRTMEHQPEFIFTVHTASGSREIEDSEDLDTFFDELAGLSFSSSESENFSLTGAGDLYVFSTACDTGLPGFLLACNVRPVNLFMIQPAEKERVKIEILRRLDFPMNGFFLLPRWFFSGKIKKLGVYANKTETVYAETKT